MTKENMMYLAGYMYNDAGEPTWYVSGPTPMKDGSTYSGYLRKYAGGITLTGSAKPVTMTHGNAGTVSITFPTATTATMTLHTGKVINLQRYILAEQAGFKFDPPAQPVPLPSYTGSAPQTGWWYAEAEGGRGWAFEVQKNPATGEDMMYMAGYMYNDKGEPTWYVSGPTKMKNASTYEGGLRMYGGGITLTGSQKPVTQLDGNVGSLSVNFSSPTTGTMVLHNGRVINLKRYILAEQAGFRFDPPGAPVGAGLWPDYWIFNNLNQGQPRELGTGSAPLSDDTAVYSPTTGTTGQFTFTNQTHAAITVTGKYDSVNGGIAPLSRQAGTESMDAQVVANCTGGQAYVMLSKAATIVPLSELVNGPPMKMGEIGVSAGCPAVSANLPTFFQFAGNGGNVATSDHAMSAAEFLAVNQSTINSPHGYIRFLAFKVAVEGRVRYGMIERGLEEGSLKPFLIVHVQKD